MIRNLFAAAACCLALVGGSAVAAPAREGVTYRLSPVFSNGALTALAVRVEYPADSSGRADFEWIRSWAGEERPWRWVRDFQVEGARRVQGDGEGRWRIAARPRARVVVSYRIVSAFDHDPSVNDDAGQAMPIVRPGWFYAVGESLFGAPAGRDHAPAAFAWTGAPAGWAFASDLQHLANPDTPGRPAARPGTVADIQESIALGGPDVRIAGSLQAPERIRIASRGDFKFTAEAFDSLALRIIHTERAFWGDGPQAPFLVTLAPLAARPQSISYSGTGRTDAFALWYDQGLSLEPARWLLAHEYFHTWNARQLGGLDPDERKEALGYWFSEGFTDYYARRLTLAAGVWTLRDFADAWNEALRSYDLAPQRTTPNSALAQAFWKDPVLKQTPYWRGSLIAAVLDAKLRADDPAGLDGLLRLQRRTAKASKTGPDAAALFRKLLRARRPDLDAWVGEVAEKGAMVTLAPDVFAPCFTVETASEPTFDRGFDLGATVRNARRVTGLEPGGPAEKAGLREGDKISIDESTTPDPTVKRRYVVHEPSGGTHVVEYLPLGPPAPVQKLVVSPGLDEAGRLRCARLFGARGHTS